MLPTLPSTVVGCQSKHLDQLCVEGMHYAENHCCKLYMGTLAYSPTLTLWFNCKILKSIIHKKLMGGQVTSHCIWCLGHCWCGIVQPLSISPGVFLFNLQAATKEYHAIQPKASQLYAEFLQQKLLSLNLTDENQQAICHILSVECSCDTFQAISHLKTCPAHVQSLSTQGLWSQRPLPLDFPADCQAAS